MFAAAAVLAGRVDLDAVAAIRAKCEISAKTSAENTGEHFGIATLLTIDAGARSGWNLRAGRGDARDAYEAFEPVFGLPFERGGFRDGASKRFVCRRSVFNSLKLF